MRDGIPWRVRKAQREAEAAKQPATPKPTRPLKRVPEGHNPHAPRGIVQWKPGRLWEGEVVCIVGGGSSLKRPENRPLLDATRGRKVIAVNNAWHPIDAEHPGAVPWADMLFFTDCEWWRWNKQEVVEKWFPLGRLTATATSDTTHVNDPRIKRFWRDRNKWTADPGKLYGWDGGTQAVNLAFHLGAKRIVLFGIDLQPGPKGETQWHEKHKRKTAVSNYREKFIPTMTEAVKKCREAGVEVIRATDGVDIGAPLVEISTCFDLSN